MTTQGGGVFPVPSEELVRHATRELGYTERLSVHKMTAGLGNTAVDVYNFPQMVNVLFDTRWDRLLVEGSKETLTWVDVDRLVVWLREVVGDPELADAVATAVAGEEGFKAQIDAMLPLFRERVGQYQDILRVDGESK